MEIQLEAETMNSADIIGYVSDGAVYCTDCAVDREEPYFVAHTADLDSSLVCDECFGVIWEPVPEYYEIVDSSGEPIESGFSSYSTAIEYAYAEVGVFCQILKYEDDGSVSIRFEGTPEQVAAEYLRIS